MNISVLGIGTELTTGQIHNSNAQWISSRLHEMGIRTSAHLVVPDNEDLILHALAFCQERSDIVFVTGGLGPTSDDFTRDVISKWAGRELIWDSASWKHIQDRLQSRGIPAGEIQKQQCYFPEGSIILTNREGTANAFHLTHKGKDIYVLPGPPREIASIWEDHISSEIKERAKDIDPLITRSWDTIGLPESEIASWLEDSLRGCPFEKAYRVHLPLVEFKLTHSKSQEQDAQKWVEAIEKTIGPFTVLRDGADAARELANRLQLYSRILICDESSGFYLLNRLFPFCKNLLKDKKLSFTSSLKLADADPSLLTLHLNQNSRGEGQATLSYEGQSTSQNFTAPEKFRLSPGREQQFQAEMALIFWMKEISA